MQKEHGRSAWDARLRAGRYGCLDWVYIRLLEAGVAAGIMLQWWAEVIADGLQE
jgi:hypothetical protein